MTLEEILPRAEWLVDFALRHPAAMEQYLFVYGEGDSKRLSRIVDTRQLDAGEIDAILTNFETRLPPILNAKWN